MSKQRHWYFITEHSCPVCGATRVFRERRYTPRPEKWEDRHDIDPTFYDYCNAL